MNPDGTQKVLVIGIDAATMDLVRPWADQGILPNFAKLFNEGCSGLLRSVPNRNSAAAWTTLMTGKNPGKHGIFFFTEYQEGSFDYSYVNASFRDGVTFYRLLDEAGFRTGVINTPMTFPAEKLTNGFMVSGMDAPGVHHPEFTHPTSLFQEMKAAIGDYTIETGLGSYMKAGKIDEGAAALVRTEQQRTKAAKFLMQNKPWDFFMVVYRSTDPAQHYFWKYMEPELFNVSKKESERWGKVIQDVYREVDKGIGELLELIDDETTVMIVSDHGASADTAKAKVLNKWLSHLGMLEYAKKSFSLSKLPSRVFWSISGRAYRQVDKRFGRKFKKRLAGAIPWARTRTESHMTYDKIDWGKTKAFNDGKRAELWINVEGRQPHGVVHAGKEYEETCDELVNRFYAARDVDSGKPLVQNIYRREEVYDGPYLERSTDLLIEWHKNAVTNKVDFGDGRVLQVDTEQADNPLERLICGAHDPMGIVFMKGPMIKKGGTIEGASLVDIAPTVLYLMGEPIPDDMDGAPMYDALDDSYIAAHPAASSEPMEYVPVGSVTGYSADDEEKIGERLRGLGYIE
jgi:predicted AlkP superfamily phosphohydrolase/phosphomutase